MTNRLASQRAAITGQPAALSIPTQIVREVLRDPDPQRALGVALDDITAICRAMLRKEMEGRRE
jgi:hypothetical protein